MNFDALPPIWKKIFLISYEVWRERPEKIGDGIGSLLQPYAYQIGKAYKSILERSFKLPKRVDQEVVDDLPNLPVLACYGCKLTDIEPIAELRALERLNLRKNVDLTSLLPLAGQTRLKSLNLLHTGVTDLGPIASATELEELIASGTEITDIGALAGMKALRKLSLGQCKLTDLGPLSGLPLEELWLSGSKVTDLGPLNNLKKLATLYAENLKVTDLGPLSNLPLERLMLWQTKITDLGPLSDVKTLVKLEVGNTKITDLEPVSKLPLEHLHISFSKKVTDLGPLRDVRTLKKLDASWVNVTSIAPLAGLPKLKELSIWGCDIQDAESLLEFKALNRLYISTKCLSAEVERELGELLPALLIYRMP